MSAGWPPIAGVVVAAGRGTRAGLDKVWADLGGRPLLLHSVATLAACGIRPLVLVVAPERLAAAHGLPDVDRVVPGGERRRDSVQNGLLALPAEAEWVLVHDGARPFVSPAVVAATVAAALEVGAAVPGVPLVDTVKRVRAGRVVETVPREELRAVQTPQVFRRALLQAALERFAEDVSDEAALVERLGQPVAVAPGDPANFKVTTAEDLERARALVARRAAGATGG